MQSGLLEQYVLGLTTEEESDEVERYAHTFPEIQAEIDLLRNALKEYAEAQIGPTKIKKLPNGNGNSAIPQNPLRVRTTRARRNWLLPLCLLLAGIFAFFQFSEAKQAKHQVSELSRDFLAFKSDCKKHQQSLHELEEKLAFYQHDSTAPLQLEGTSLAPDSKVRIFWNEHNETALLQVVSLPDLPQSKQYQVWADINGKMVNLGLIDPRLEKPQSIRCFPKASSLNITLEPLGGSDEPHVDQLYANVNL